MSIERLGVQGALGVSIATLATALGCSLKLKVLSIKKKFCFLNELCQKNSNACWWNKCFYCRLETITFQRLLQRV